MAAVRLDLLPVERELVRRGPARRRVVGRDEIEHERGFLAQRHILLVEALPPQMRSITSGQLPLNRLMMFMHSGSPKRALNSITFTPSAVAKKPLFIAPVKWRPCWARRSMTRSMIEQACS